MRVELDVSLENPSEIIDLTLIKKVLLKNNSYQVLQHKLNNYLLLQDIHEDFKIRVHEDGRIYVKMDIDHKQDASKKKLLNKLVKELKYFLDKIGFINQISLKNEINFSFSGSMAYTMFWERYNELKQLGKAALITYNLRTYTYTDSIYVKLESSNQINIESCYACA